MIFLYLPIGSTIYVVQWQAWQNYVHVRKHTRNVYVKI